MGDRPAHNLKRAPILFATEHKVFPASLCPHHFGGLIINDARSNTHVTKSLTRRI